MKKVIVVVILIAVGFVACEDKFDLKAPWKEVMSIYGLLDQSQAVQYIKINKAFLGDGNATDIAQISDSSNYNPADLEVKLQRMKNGAQIGADILLSDTVLEDKRSGVFASSNNIVYKTRDSLFNDSDYKLIVKNKKTGHEATATTPLVGDFSVSLLANTVGFVVSPGVYSSFKVRWTSVANAKIYQLKIRFNYTETEGQIVTNKSVDWVFGTQKIDKVKAGTEMYQEVSGTNFYQFLKSIKSGSFPSNTVVRTDGFLDFTVTCGGDELSTYIDVTQPSSNINQEKPFYTNVNNGIGIFSCRYVSNVVSKKLSANSLLELKIGQFTSDLNFQ